MDKKKTGFSTGPGNKIYEFKVMLFSITTAPATFQLIMDNLQYSFKHSFAYLDDIIIFYPTLDEHVKKVDNVLSIFKDSGLKLYPGKCRFTDEKIEFI